MSLRRIVSALCVCVLFFGLGSAAKAQWGGGYGGFGLPYSAYTLNVPPYFALFPPVYYSHVTPRPYGFSPFAYPGFMITPERLRMPSTPFVPNVRRQVVPRPAPAAQARAKPVIIKNPYVLAEENWPSRLADGRPLPQVISPAAFASASKPAPIGLDR
jgi:hypothetical protein